MTTSQSHDLDVRAATLDLANVMQSALLSVADFMIADWGKPDDAAKKVAIDALLAKLAELSSLQQAMLTRIAETGRDGGVA